jgi:hypothetical protein
MSVPFSKVVSISQYLNAVGYSRGADTYANQPAQLKAVDFQEFIDQIKNDLSSKKGEAYICAAMEYGYHDDQKKHPNQAHWRLATHAKTRRFLAFDFDGFSSPTIFDELVNYFKKYSSLLYTTASYTELEPRARAIVELDRCVDRREGIQLGDAVQLEIESHFGFHEIKFDKSVYRAEQPIYTPLVNTKIWEFDGQPINVDSFLNSVRVSAVAKSLNADLMQSAGFEFPNELVDPGSRNTTLLKYAGQLRSKGLSETEIVSLAQAANLQRFSQPLDNSEVLDICGRYANCTNQSSFDTPSQSGTFSNLSGAISIPTQFPPKRSYVFANTVTPGTLCTVGGSGGTSKTMLLMQIAVAMASGSKFGDFQVANGSSLLILGEEDASERDRRFGGICQHMSADIKLVVRRVKCFAASGIDIRLTLKVDGNPQETLLAGQIIELAKQHAIESEAPVRMIVVDHARLALGGDPNAADDVTQLTRVLNNIATQTGAAVVLIAHSPKSVLAKTGDEINAADVAGSSAFVDNSRATFMAYGMRSDEAKLHHISEEDRKSYVRFANVKANYAISGGGNWFRRVVLPDWEVAVLEPATLVSPSRFQKKAVTALRDKILAELRVKAGGVTMRYLRDIAGIKGRLQASEEMIRKEVVAMLNDGLIESRKPTSVEKKQFRLAPTVREVLVPLF